MARIKIEDLPILEDLSAKEIKGIFGGTQTLRDDSTDESYATETSTESSVQSLGADNREPLGNTW